MFCIFNKTSGVIYNNGDIKSMSMSEKMRELIEKRTVISEEDFDKLLKENIKMFCINDWKKIFLYVTNQGFKARFDGKLKIALNFFRHEIEHEYVLKLLFAWKNKIKIEKDKLIFTIFQFR